MTKQQRPRRQRKGDRLLNPGASREQIACDFTMAGFDRAAREMERKWGIDRLPELVSAETAQRYGIAMADMNAAIEREDAAGVLATSQNCIKGLQVMDAEATAAGAQPASGDFWEYELDTGEGEPFRFAIMRDNAEWQIAKSKRPDLLFFTMREVANALCAYSKTFPIGEVKEHFPGAQITNITAKLPKDFWERGDEFSF